MKRTLTIDFDQAYLHLWLLVIRVAVALSMMTHGMPKFFQLIGGGEIQFPDPIGLGPSISLGLTVFSEVVCSTFIFIGLGTRIATIPLIVTMLVAALIVHADEPFGKREMALLYLFPYITLLILGSGKYSIDYLLRGQLISKK
jgi:putative oxidoreductase